MSAITKSNSSVVATGYFSPEQKRLIKRTIMDESATDDDLLLFGQVCNRLGLDPFARQINAIKRGWGSNEKWSFEPTIDGYRAVADATGLYGGSETFWCGEDGIWRDVWLSNEPPVAAKTIVWRKDSTKPFVAVAKFDSYKGVKKDGGLNSIWAKFPDLMVAKCSESLALRKAFPRQLSGVYTSEEMQQSKQSIEAEVVNEKEWDVKDIKPLRESLGWSSFQFLSWLKNSYGVEHPRELNYSQLKKLIINLQGLILRQEMEEINEDEVEETILERQPVKDEEKEIIRRMVYKPDGD